MKKKEFQNSFLNGLYERRYLIITALVFAFFTVALIGVRPAPDAKVKFIRYISCGGEYQNSEFVARCKVLKIYNPFNFYRISKRNTAYEENIKEFFVNSGTCLKRGETYYIYRPPKGSLNNRAIFRDSSWNWGYMTKTFLLSAIIWYVVLEVVLLLLGSLGTCFYEKNLD